MLSSNSQKIINSFPTSKIPSYKLTNQEENIIKDLLLKIDLSNKRAKSLIENKKILINAQTCVIKDFIKEISSSWVCKKIKENCLKNIDYCIEIKTVIYKTHTTIKIFLNSNDLNLFKYNSLDTEILLTTLILLYSFSKKKTSIPINITFIFSTVKRYFPTSDLDIVGPCNLNGGYAESNKKLVVYRKEEWLKVFIHECMHYFSLDSGLQISLKNNYLSTLFNIDPDILLSESYCEYWARILNCLISGYKILPEKNVWEVNKKYILYLLEAERFYSLILLSNFLQKVNLKYDQIISNDYTLYKENTNAIAYIVVTAILMNQYGFFLLWFKKYNFPLLRFDKSINVDLFIEEIYKKCNTPELLKCLSLIKKKKYNLKLNNSSRMSSIELKY